jgi:hypothetical protein
MPGDRGTISELFGDVRVERWQDDSGAALVLGWRSGELVDLLPAYAATAGGSLSECYLINESVAPAAVVDPDGEQLTAMAFEAEQYRQIKALGRPVSGACTNHCSGGVGSGPPGRGRVRGISGKPALSVRRHGRGSAAALRRARLVMAAPYRARVLPLTRDFR